MMNEKNFWSIDISDDHFDFQNHHREHYYINVNSNKATRVIDIHVHGNSVMKYLFQLIATQQCKYVRFN